MTNLVTQNEILYMAGVFDGEGHMGIKLDRKPTRDFFGGKICIEMTNDEPITLFKDTWGGQINQKILPSGKISYGYNVPSSRQEDFLVTMTPHLKVKNKQAITLMNFIKLRKHKSILGVEYFDKQRQLYNIIRTLNA